MSFKTKKLAIAAAIRTFGANYAEHYTIENKNFAWEIEPIRVGLLAEVEEVINIGEAAIPADTAVWSNMLGQMSGAPVPAPVAPTPAIAPKVAGLTIEKERPMQNGIKRPSAGGACRAVWDYCWSFAPAGRSGRSVPRRRQWPGTAC